MTTIDFKTYAPIITDDTLGDEIYSEITLALEKGAVEIDLSEIESMATFNAKQIFGKLYLKLGPKAFFDKVKIKGANDDLKTIINLGIEKALAD